MNKENESDSSDDDILIDGDSHAKKECGKIINNNTTEEDQILYKRYLNKLLGNFINIQDDFMIFIFNILVTANQSIDTHSINTVLSYVCVFLFSGITINIFTKH